MLDICKSFFEFLLFTVIVKGIIAHFLADQIIRQAKRTETGRLHLDRVKTVFQSSFTAASR